MFQPERRLSLKDLKEYFPITFADVSASKFVTKPLVSKVAARPEQRYIDRSQVVDQLLNEEGLDEGERSVLKPRMRKEIIELPMVEPEMHVAEVREEKKMERLKEVYGTI